MLEKNTLGRGCGMKTRPILGITVRHGTVRYSTARYNTRRYDTVRCSGTTA